MQTPCSSIAIPWAIVGASSDFPRSFDLSRFRRQCISARPGNVRQRSLDLEKAFGLPIGRYRYVWEWVVDAYDAVFWGSSADTDPRGPEKGNFRHPGGGGPGNDGQGKLRSSERFKFYGGNQTSGIGFRCAMDTDPSHGIASSATHPDEGDLRRVRHLLPRRPVKAPVEQRGEIRMGSSSLLIHVEAMFVSLAVSGCDEGKHSTTKLSAWRKEASHPKQRRSTMRFVGGHPSPPCASLRLGEPPQPASSLAFEFSKAEGFPSRSHPMVTTRARSRQARRSPR